MHPPCMLVLFPPFSNVCACMCLLPAQEALECPHLSHGDEEDDGLEALGLEASSSGMLFAQVP